MGSSQKAPRPLYGLPARFWRHVVKVLLSQLPAFAFSCAGHESLTRGTSGGNLHAVCGAVVGNNAARVLMRGLRLGLLKAIAGTGLAASAVLVA